MGPRSWEIFHHVLQREQGEHYGLEINGLSSVATIKFLEFKRKIHTRETKLESSKRQRLKNNHIRSKKKHIAVVRQNCTVSVRCVWGIWADAVFLSSRYGLVGGCYSVVDTSDASTEDKPQDGTSAIAGSSATVLANIATPQYLVLSHIDEWPPFLPPTHNITRTVDASK